MAHLLHSTELSSYGRTLAVYVGEQILLGTGYKEDPAEGSLDQVIGVAIRVIEYVQAAGSISVPGPSWTLLNGGWRVLDTLIEVTGADSGPAENNGARQRCATYAHIAETTAVGSRQVCSDATDGLVLLKATARVLAHSSLATEHPRLIELSRNLDTVT